MGLNFCHNCGERMITLTEKCPKCGIIPKKSTSPVFLGFLVIAGMTVMVILGFFLF